MKALLEDIARGIVDKPEAVSVEARVDDASGRETLLVLNVAREDRGRLIGRQGRTLRAMRTLVRAMAEKSGRNMTLDMAR